MKNFNEKQTTGLQLRKDSEPEQIKSYFLQVLKLAQTGEEFPINFNEVWQLIYNHRRDAVASLKRNFIENIDYQAMRRNPQRGAASPIDYTLTVSCLEFFIARKVRPVFDVYRQVFHKAMLHQLNESNINTLPVYDVLKDFSKEVKQVELNEIDYYNLADILFFIGSRSSAYLAVQNCNTDGVIKMKYKGIGRASYFIDEEETIDTLKHYSTKHSRAKELLKQFVISSIDKETAKNEFNNFFENVFGQKIAEDIKQRQSNRRAV